MKIKILLTGNNESRIKFLQSLQSQVTFTQAAASVNIVGTGTYKFRLDNDDIEIMYIEDHPLLKKNFKNYAIDAHAMILVDADQDTTELLKAAFPKATPLAIHVGGGEINGMNGVKAIVDKCHTRQNRLTSNPSAQFSKKPVDTKTESPAQSINFELMKKFLDATPKRRL